MAEITVNEKVWHALVEIARRRRTRPEELARTALREFLQRQADEELLAKSSRSAQETSFRIRDTEEIIREHRKRKKKS